MNLARSHVGEPRRKREEAERQATESEIEYRKREEKNSEENKQKQKQNKNKNKKQTRKLKTQTGIQHAPRWTCPSRRNRPAIVSPWWNLSLFQRSRSWVASRETACQGNSIPRETGEWKTVLNYMTQERFIENEYEGWPPSQKQCSIRASRRAFNYAQGKMDTETNSVVTAGINGICLGVDFALCIITADLICFTQNFV